MQIVGAAKQQYTMQLAQMTATTCAFSPAGFSQQKLIIRGYFNNNSNVNALQFMARQVCAGHVLAYFEHPDKTAMAMTALSRPM